MTGGISLLKLDGEKVKVERFTEEEDEEWSEHLRSGKFNILPVRIGYIDFNYSSVKSLLDEEACKKAWRKLCRRKALAMGRSSSCLSRAGDTQGKHGNYHNVEFSSYQDIG